MKLYYIYKLSHEHAIIASNIDGIVYDISYEGCHDKMFYLITSSSLPNRFLFNSRHSKFHPGIFKFIGKHFILEISNEKISEMKLLFDIDYRDGGS